MAQDYGDDAGEKFLRACLKLARELAMLKRRSASYNPRAQAQQTHKAQQEQARASASSANKSTGQSVAELNEVANVASANDVVVVPFGTQELACAFADFCRRNAIFWVQALTDGSHKGFLAVERASEITADDLIAFAREKNTPEIKQQLMNLAKELAVAEPLSAKVLSELEPVAAELNMTEQMAYDIAQAHSLDALREEGIGTTISAKGEFMFYRVSEEHYIQGAKLPEFDSKRDWSVSAKKLAEKYNVSTAHLKLLANEVAESQHEQQQEVVVADGARDADGRTPDADQQIKSHDGSDTDTRSARMDKEQTGSDVAPSVAREENREVNEEGEEEKLDVEQEEADAYAASEQLAHESAEHSIDVSKFMNPER